MAHRILGDYNVLKQIGQGSLGNVFLAEHRFMKKQYVLKVLPEELATDKSFIQRFEDEVSLLASLDHPHIVKIHNVSFAEGCYFLVMDCVVDSLGETTNFAQLLTDRQGRFSEDELLRLLKQLASAIDYAHSKQSGTGQVIHRGLKLSNILVGSSDANALKIYVSDFGLSKIIGTQAVLSRTFKSVTETLGIESTFEKVNGKEQYATGSVDSAKLKTLHNSFLQNFAFLAPEQKNSGADFPVGSAVDIYAFGILTYYAITQKFPEGIFEMPSMLAPEYKMNWDLFVCHCLQVDPSKRPVSLMASLDRFLTEKKALLTPQTVGLKQNESQGDLLQAMQSMEKAKVETREQAPKAKQFVKAQAVSTSQVEPPKVSPMGNAEVSSSSVGHRVSSQTIQNLKPVIQESEIKRPQYDPDPGAIFNIETTVSHYQPKPQEVRNIEPILTDMVVIEGGHFFRGSNDGNRDEMSRHQISLSSFAIDVHPIANEQYVRFLEAMGGEKDANNNDMIRLRESRIKRIGGQLSVESGYNKHPVVGITWYGAVAYAKWIGKRLPTEAEWEVAATSGTSDLIFPTGETIEKQHANFFSSDTTAVMSYPPNALGIYDMAGNVYEWCQDWYGYNYYETSAQEPDNPKGPLQGVYRVLRGGCWKSLKEDMRCSHRHRNNPGTENRTYGFRCATDTR